MFKDYFDMIETADSMGGLDGLMLSMVLRAPILMLSLNTIHLVTILVIRTAKGSRKEGKEDAEQ